MKTALIFAAGRGTRLKPLTDYIPKPLCQIQNKPLIEHLVAQVAQSGFTRVIINHAYLGGQIRQHFADKTNWDIEICYLPEPPGGLETGGTLYAALPLLGPDPFITINADIVTDYDFSALHLERGNLAHLVLAPNPPNYPGDFGLNADGKLTHEKSYTFTGIACYHPAAFQHYKTGRYSVTPLLYDLCTKNVISGELYHGSWINVDSLERLKLANSLKNEPSFQSYA